MPFDQFTTLYMKHPITSETLSLENHATSKSNPNWRILSAVAIPVSHIDRELAERCDEKADYWLNPDHYDQQRVQVRGIDLESVRERYRSLLFPRVCFLARGRQSRIDVAMSGELKVQS
jgi:hypothetical protein